MDVKPISRKIIKVGDLYVRYIPVVTPVEMWAFDMSLPNSPHVELMGIFLRHGFDRNRIKPSRYFHERRHRKVVGLTKWTDEKIWSHIKDRYRVFRSIQKKGYSTRLARRDEVKVLSQPFWKTRFGKELPWLKGMEIWNGAGRCAAAYVLGMKTIPVLMCRDKKPGSGDKGKFANKLKNVEGVWE